MIKRSSVWYQSVSSDFAVQTKSRDEEYAHAAW